MAAAITGYLNISDSCAEDAVWQMWRAELHGTTIELHEDRLGHRDVKSKPKRSLAIKKGVDLKPAALETGRVLAFKLVLGDTLMAVIEPQNIEDMGRWVSGLFKIIQEIQMDTPKVTSAVMKPRRMSTPDEAPKPRPRSLSTQEEPHVPQVSSPTLQRSVSVRDLRKKFEIQEKEQIVPSPSRLARSRSMSSLSAKPAAEKKERVGFTRQQSVTCWRGPYLEQEEEREVLSQITNPYLVRLKIRRKEEMIANMRETVEELLENKKTLEDELTAAQMAKDITSHSSEGNKNQSRDRPEWLESRNRKIRVQLASESDRIAALLSHVQQLENEVEQLKEKLPVPVNFTPEPVRSADPNDPEDEESGPIVQIAITQTHIDADAEDMGKPEWTRRAQKIARAWTTLVKDDRLQ